MFGIWHLELSEKNNMNIRPLKLAKNDKYASFLPRFLAFLIDAFILNLPFMFAVLLIAKKDSWEEMIAFGVIVFTTIIVPSGIFSILYYPFFLSRHGKTIGKAILGLKLTDKNNQFLSFKQVIFRQNICKPVSMSLIGLGFIAMLFDKDHQAWHDKLVGSYVHKEANRAAVGFITVAVLIYAHYYFVQEIILAFSKYF